MTYMLSSSQHLVDTEDKENLELDRQGLLQFQKYAKELLHINDKYISLEKFLKQYEIDHAYLCKAELEIQMRCAEEVFYFLINYK